MAIAALLAPTVTRYARRRPEETALFEASRCSPVCGGRRRVIAVLKNERVTRKILAHLGLPDEAPKLAPAPEEPQGELWPPGPPMNDFAQPSAPEEYDQRWGTIDEVK